MLPFLLLSLTVNLAAIPAKSAARPPSLSFRMQEIDTTLGVGYAVLVADLNPDGKPDLIVVDQTRVLWYENPTWKRRTLLEGQTRPDNVCVAAYDLDGDGLLDLALGADWKGLSSQAEGNLYWLRRGQSLDESWRLYPLGAEPSVHRIRFADLDGDGKAELVVVPLLGRGSTAQGNWMDGLPVRILAYRIPADPVKDRWVPEVVDESLHVVHNFWPVPRRSGPGLDLLMASYEGVTLLAREPTGRWRRQLLGTGNQDNPKGNRGASEIKQGRLRGGPYLATIEPWHGNQVVVYTPPIEQEAGLWQRQVLDTELRWGHAVWCADLDGDGDEELIIGVRDDVAGKPATRRGIRLYKALDQTGTRWGRQILENGGVAVEDLAAADLDGDGRLDLIAAGRQTHNLRIYWNQTGK